LGGAVLFIVSINTIVGVSMIPKPAAILSKNRLGNTLRSTRRPYNLSDPGIHDLKDFSDRRGCCSIIDTLSYDTANGKTGGIASI